MEGEAHFDTSSFPIANVDTEAVPVGVKQAMWVQEPGDAGEGLARQELEERCEVLRAYMLGGKDGVSELMGVREVGETAFGLKGEHWGCRALVVEVTKRGAE